MGLLDLPVELLFHISSFVKLSDLFELLHANRYLWNLLEMEFINRDAQQKHSQALLWAALCGYKSMAQKALDAGIGLDALFSADYWAPKTTGMTHTLCHSTNNGTALHFAVREGKMGPIKLLLGLGADPLCENVDGKTPSDLSMLPFIVKLAGREDDPDPNTEIAVILSEHIQNLDRLPLQHGSTHPMLCRAIHCRLVRIIRHYIHRGVDIHHVSVSGQSILNLALKQFQTPGSNLVTGKNRDTVWVMLTAGEDPEEEYWGAWRLKVRRRQKKRFIWHELLDPPMGGFV